MDKKTQQVIATYEKQHGETPASEWLVKNINISKENAIGELYIYNDGDPEIMEEKKDLNPKIIKTAMLIIAITATVLSVYYSTMWFSQSLFLPLAIALAVVMVTYGVIGPQVSLMFKGLLKFLLFGTAIVVIIFSMVATVAGQFDKYDHTIRQNYDIENDLLTRQIEQKEKDIDRLQTLLEDFDTVDDRTSGGGAYYYSTKNDLEKAYSELSVLYESVADQPTPEYNFYIFLSSIFGIRENVIQFILSLFPAVFIDIIAPLSIIVYFKI